VCAAASCPTGGEQQQQPTDQQLLGRRLLQALVGVWRDKSKNNSGTRMCFYAQVKRASTAALAADESPLHIMEVLLCLVYSVCQFRLSLCSRILAPLLLLLVLLLPDTPSRCQYAHPPLLLLLLCPQELNPKLGRARGLDLHSVAARLEQGLYQATGQPLQVRGRSDQIRSDQIKATCALVICACRVWLRLRMVPAFYRIAWMSIRGASAAVRPLPLIC
jgi:hypothetical protein